MFARLWIVVVIVTVVTAATPRALASSSDGTHEGVAASSDEDRTSGARFHLGILALGHARRPDGAFASSFAGAPGLALGLLWRFGAWEVGPRYRYASWADRTFADDYGVSRATIFSSVGGRATWFVAPDSTITPLIGLEADWTYLETDQLSGSGMSVRASGGVEVGHDRGHHRLALEVGIDVPTFRVEYERSDAGPPPAISHLYLIPFSLELRWTF